MLLSFAAVVLGLLVLVWSADRFVDGASNTARYLGMPPLLIGMVIVGFGTSAPEMVVSALAAGQGNPGIALGNAYGSNITNIALILGVTAVISPIVVHSRVLKKELPILLAATGIALWQLWDGQVTRFEAWVLLGVFSMLMAWTVWAGLKNKGDSLGEDVNSELNDEALSIKAAIFWLVFGLLLLIVSSRILVWGAVEIAQSFGVSDLIIGLTILAIGTSLPELASSVIAARKKEHDIALGNIIGSNLFNTLAVVGIAGVISPMQVGREVLYRDISMMTTLTIALFIMGYGFKNQGRINRFEGLLLLSAFVGYLGYLLTN